MKHFPPDEKFENLKETMIMKKIRIKKIIADEGYCSRRKAEELIFQKRVKVNVHPAITGQKLDQLEILLLLMGKNFTTKERNNMFI